MQYSHQNVTAHASLRDLLISQGLLCVFIGSLYFCEVIV